MPDTPPTILYKYMPSSRDSFFRRPQLRFTPSDRFTSLYECVPKIKGVINLTGTKNAIENQHKRMTAWLISKMPILKEGLLNDFTQLICAATLKKAIDLIKENSPLVETQETQSLTAKILGMEFNSNTYGILCLTSDPANTLMWEQYTPNLFERHQGFVIGFDSTHPFFNRQDSREGMIGRPNPVYYPSYDDLPYASDFFSDDNFNTMLIKNIFFTKDPLRSYEKEWRMIIPLADKATQDSGNIEEIPHSAIKEIYLGVKAESLQDSAKAFCKQREIALFRMVRACSGRLVPENILDR